MTSLRLSLKNIIEIDNLTNFDSLAQLRLDNNIIDRITNIDHLSNLKWLDLSFNNITKIEGLDALVNLTDLSLCNNQIETIEGLDNCTKLHVFSISRNHIKDLKKLEYLRRFPELRCVCFDHNPICQLEHYTVHVMAYLTQLKYLDFMLIDWNSEKAVLESYQLDDLSELREKEGEEKHEQDLISAKLAERDELKKSFMDLTFGLFGDVLFSPETEPEQLSYLNGYQAVKDDYKEKLDEMTKALLSFMNEQNTLRMRSLLAFEQALDEVLAKSEKKSRDTVCTFQTKKKSVLDKLEYIEPEEGDELLDKLLSEVLELKHQHEIKHKHEITNKG